MIRGEHIYLTPLDRTNAETARAWVNDPDTNAWMASGHVPVSREQELAFYDAVESSDEQQVFEIHLAEDGRYIGNGGLDHLDLRNRAAEIGIMIGEPEARGRGYGRDALLTLMRHAFDTLGLNTVRIAYIEGNERGERLYRSLGFKDAGRHRQRFFLRGEFHDLVYLDMLAEEWRTSER